MTGSTEDYGTILLFGGGGFLGTEIIEQLQSTGGWSRIVVASRNPAQDFPKVTYRACDITNQKSVEQLLDDVKPRIMREASAFESWVEVKPSMFEATIEQEMGKYEVFKESLETNASKQSELLETIQVRWVAFKFKLNFLTYSYIDLLSVVHKLAPRG